jgi:hypothetical protein
MKDAASRLLISQRVARVTAFKKTPSLKLYTELVNESPDLKPALLQATRLAIFPLAPSSERTISYSTAAEILNAASETNDLVRLLAALPEYSRSDPTIAQAQRTIIRHLSKQSAPEHRKTALDAITNGLNSAIQNVLDEILRIFPGFDDAYDWLEDQIDEGKLSHKAPGDSKDYFKMTPAQRKLIDQRNKKLDQFIERAARYNDEFGFDGTVDDFRDPMDGVDPDDSDYEEQKNASHPNLQGTVRMWVQMLQDWPNKKAAKKVQDIVRGGFEGNLLFGVDGAAEALASRYHLASLLSSCRLLIS